MIKNIVDQLHLIQKIVQIYLFTSNQSVSDVSRRAGTDGSFGTSTVVSRGALSVGTTGIWLAEVTYCKIIKYHCGKM